MRKQGLLHRSTRRSRAAQMDFARESDAILPASGRPGQSGRSRAGRSRCGAPYRDLRRRRWPNTDQRSPERRLIRNRKEVTRSARARVSPMVRIASGSRSPTPWALGPGPEGKTASSRSVVGTSSTMANTMTAAWKAVFKRVVLIPSNSRGSDRSIPAYRILLLARSRRNDAPAEAPRTAADHADARRDSEGSRSPRGFASNTQAAARSATLVPSAWRARLTR
jgi:hypothetical protein